MGLLGCCALVACWFGFDPVTTGHGGIGDGLGADGAPFSSVRVVSAYLQACAIRADGTLWCWGYDNYSELGNGPGTTPFPTPQQVGTDTDWIRVAAAAGTPARFVRRAIID